MVEVIYSTPHKEKLKALLNNSKMPKEDMICVERQLVKYEAWISDMNSLKKQGNELLSSLVELLNKYKKSVEFDLIFCSNSDFLYRQKGQLKLDNTVLEEFLPRLFDERIVKGFVRQSGLECGPKPSFAGLSFDSPLLPLQLGGVYLKKKDQDFSVARKHHITISRPDKLSDAFTEEFYVSYFATEIKSVLSVKVRKIRDKKFYIGMV